MKLGPLARARRDMLQYQVFGYHDHKHKTRARRDTSSDDSWQEADSFTHQDIVEELVRYTPNPNGPESETKDGFTYLLEADNVQPAKGMFSFTVKPGGGGKTGPVTDKDGGIHISPRTGEPPKTTPMPPLPTIGDNKHVTSSGTHVSFT